MSSNVFTTSAGFAVVCICDRKLGVLRPSLRLRGFPYHDKNPEPYDKNKIDYDKNW